MLFSSHFLQNLCSNSGNKCSWIVVINMEHEKYGEGRREGKGGKKEAKGTENEEGGREEGKKNKREFFIK